MMSEQDTQPQSAAPLTPTRLSMRLMEIVSSIPPCERVIDVGSDHGHVISYLLENHIAQSAVATDIHIDPAETTKRYLRRQGVMQHAEVYHTDGLHGIRLIERDVVVISGLGGVEMIRILSETLEEHKGAFPRNIRWILQPQRSFEELRVYLFGVSFRIDRESICLDREKIYMILQAEWTGAAGEEMSLTQRVLGPRILESRPPHFEEYLHHQKNVLKKHMRARPELADVLKDIDMLLRGELTDKEVLI